MRFKSEVIGDPSGYCVPVGKRRTQAGFLNYLFKTKL